MLCLVLAACCSFANAEHIYLSPRNHSQFKEESTFTSTSIVDPWSPVMGDTEGAPGVTTRAESLHARRAAISLVENIRRQLMRDNYDYTSDKSEEPFMFKTSSPSQDNSKRSDAGGSPKPSQTSPPGGPISLAAVSLRRTRMWPPLSVKPMLSLIQVARVKMPSKSNSKQHFRSYSESSTLRSLDEKSHRQATTMAKDVKSEIDVSKKDLLFYIDDAHLRRNNPRSAVASIAGRREYGPNNMTNKININGLQQNRIPTQKLKSRNSVKDKNSNVKYNINYDVNQNNRRSIELDIKTQSHPDNKNEAVEADGERSYGAIDDKERMKHIDNKRLSSISEPSHLEAGEINKLGNRQINVSLSSNSVNQDMTKEPQSSDVNKEIHQNYEANWTQRENDEEHKMLIGNREQFRRSNHRRNHRRNHRHNHNRNHKYIEQPNESQHDDSTDDKDIHHSIRQVVKPQINGRSRNIYNEHNKNKPYKHKASKSSREKKVPHNNNSKNENRKHSNKRLHDVPKIYESGRNGSNKRKRKRYQSEETVTQKSNQPEKQSDDDNSLYSQNINDDTTDMMTDKVIIRKSTVRSATSDHRRHILKKVNKNNNVDSKQSDSVNQNDNHSSNNVDGDSSHDELKNGHNEDKNQKYKGQKSQYIDSMDNEDVDKFDGRRMNRPSNNTQLVKELDVQDSQCNNTQHDCFSEQNNNQSFTTNGEELTSLTAKYKLLKVRAAGGSRRSNIGERRFLQERGPKGVALFALDGAPFPQFRLPRSRRQYMDDQADKRPPLIEQISRRSFNKKQ